MAYETIYSQFCPIARAAEVLAERWTPLVVRELICGSTRFNDLQRGLPRMSSSLLSRRLKELEAVGIVERRATGNGRSFEYHITECGRDLFPVLIKMGEWSQRWVRADLVEVENLDPDLLMWDIRRNVTSKGIPADRRFIAHFYFKNMPHQRREHWLKFEHGDVDLCYRDPGYGNDITVLTDVLTLVEVWLGHLPLLEALASSRLELQGSPQDALAFRSWFTLSIFAPAGQQPPGKGEAEPV